MLDYNHRVASVNLCNISIAYEHQQNDQWLARQNINVFPVLRLSGSVASFIFEPPPESVVEG